MANGLPRLNDQRETLSRRGANGGLGQQGLSYALYIFIQ